MKTLIALLLVLASLPGPDAHAWGRFEGGHHPEHGGTVWARPNPVVVHNVYVHHDNRGCVGCGAGVAAVAGLIGGAIIGAAIAGSSPPQTYIEPAPVMVQAPPQPVYVVPSGPPIGSEVSFLPPGCTNMNINGTTLYQCGGTWYQPFFGGNSVYYSVVPAP